MNNHLPCLVHNRYRCQECFPEVTTDSTGLLPVSIQSSPLEEKDAQRESTRGDAARLNWLQKCNNEARYTGNCIFRWSKWRGGDYTKHSKKTVMETFAKQSTPP